MRLTPAEWAEAQERCTPAQLAALDLWRRELGYKRISLILHIHPTTAKARVEAGLRHLGLSIHHYANR